MACSEIKTALVSENYSTPGDPAVSANIVWAGGQQGREQWRCRHIAKNKNGSANWPNRDD